MDPKRKQLLEAFARATGLPLPDEVDVSEPAVTEPAPAPAAPPVEDEAQLLSPPAPATKAAPAMPSGPPSKYGVAGGPDVSALYSQLQQSRAKGDEHRFQNNMGRAMNTFTQALTGAKADNGFYDNMDEQAALPEKQALKDFDLSEIQRQKSAAVANKDPSSPENRAAQLTFKNVNPELAAQIGDAALGGMTADDLKPYIGVQDKRSNNAANLDIKGQALGVSKDKVAESGRHNLVSEANAQTGLALQAAAPGHVDNRNTNNSVQKLGAATSKTFSEFKSTLEDIEKDFPGLIAGKVPRDFELTPADKAALKVPFGLGSNFVTPKMQKLQTQVKTVRDLISRARSGAVLNASEEKHYLSLIGDNIFSNPQALAEGLRTITKGIGEKLRDTQLAYGPAASPGLASLPAYEEAGGTSYNNPIWGLDTPPAAPPRQAPPMPTSAPVREPGGAQAPVPGAGPRRTELADGSVWEELPDGSAKMLRGPKR